MFVVAPVVSTTWMVAIVAVGLRAVLQVGWVVSCAIAAISPFVIPAFEIPSARLTAL
jgi:hypothetical protein